MVVEELEPNRDLHRQPLFQIAFTLQPISDESWDMPGLQLEGMAVEGTDAKFDLTFAVQESPSAVSVTVEYASEIFDPETVRRIIGHWERFLSDAVSKLDKPISRVEILDEEERNKLLNVWNYTEYTLPKASLPELFEQQVKNNPNAIALCTEDEEWTYRVLDDRSNVIAHCLRRANVAPEELVGVCLDRTPMFVAALLGILKAGAVYVPLDPLYPIERLQYLLRDTKSRIIVTNAQHSNIIATLQPAVVLDVDNLEIDNITPFKIRNPNADQLAYVMYTSGSTGIPKGVAVSHKAIVRLVFGLPGLSFCKEDVFLAAAPLGFDASTFEIWTPLLNGAKLAFVTSNPTLEELHKALTGFGFTTLWLTASLFHLMEATLPGAFINIKKLLTGGDVVSASAVERVLHRGGPVVVNGYGPTETTTFACIHIMAPTAEELERSIPIGKPIGNTKVYVLDGAMRLVPEGVTGELYIGGAGLARGYWSRPAVTAERFLPNAYSTSPGERLYRTGDLVYWRPEGCLEFVGRTDRQVKIRGFRVELAEVETALLRYPNVTEAAVLAFPGLDGSLALEAYVEGTGTLEADLAEFLRRILPEHSLPSRFVFLNPLPRNPSGKLDRDSLAEKRKKLVVDGARRRSDIAPRDRLELTLVRIWEDLLGHSDFDIHSEFFSVGGTSLLSLALVSRITNALGTALPAALLFQNRTIESQAAVVRSRTRWNPHLSDDIVIPLTQDSGRSPLILVHTGSGTALCYYHLAQAIRDEATVLGIQSPGLLEEVPLYRSVEESALYYLEKITQIRPHGPYRLGGISAGGPIAFEMARRLTEQNETVESVFLFDASAPPPNQLGRADLVLPSETDLLWDMLQQMESQEIDEDTFRALSQEDQLLQVSITAKTSHRAPPDLQPSEISRLTTVLSQAGRARSAYCGRQYDGQVVLFRAEDQQQSPSQSVALGWERYCKNVEVHFVGGTHQTMLNLPFVPRLAATLQSYL
jgi:amino acid adenylation domain-containing protein